MTRGLLEVKAFNREANPEFDIRQKKSSHIHAILSPFTQKNYKSNNM